MSIELNLMEFYVALYGTDKDVFCKLAISVGIY